MYDQERMVEMARGHAVTSGSAEVECLLDFSQGPGAIMIATMGAPTYLVPKIADEERYVKVEEGRNPTTAPSSTLTNSPGISPTLQSPHSTTSSTEALAVKPRAICSFCGKSFVHLGDHNKHRRRHTGERPYSCDLCPLRFAHASNLARHRRLHSGEKPFGCGGCGKTFSRKDKLAMHVARRCCEKTRQRK